MKAIILTAGYGNRMRPLTLTTHKTLLKIGNQTVINRIVDNLLAYGIEDIVLVTGYRAEDLQAHLTADYPHVPITYIHNERFAQTNNIFSLALAFENITIDSDILVIESDLIYQPEILGRLLASEHENVALVDRYQIGMDGTVVTIEDDVITNVIPPHLQGEDFDFTDKFKTLNIYKFSQKFSAETFKRLLTYYARVIDDNCYYELILGILIYMQREIIHAEVLQGEVWAEMDDPNDLNLARFLFEKEAQKALLDRSFGGFWNYGIIDFAFIRNMYFPTTAILSELKNNLPQLVHNYGSTQQILNRKLAYFLLCQQEHVHLLNGISQIYPVLRRYFAGKQVLMPTPTFGEYGRIFPQASTYPDEFGIDAALIEETAVANQVIVIVNPNNPTGSVVDSQWIYDFAVTNPDKTIIVDESFIEFANTPSLLPMLEQSPQNNIIILKSLSKSLGVPGVRLGYVYSNNPDFHAFVRQEIPIWNMNSVAEYFLEVILKHRNALQHSFELTVEDREKFATLLAKSPVIDHVFASGGNFLLVRLRVSNEQADCLAKKLLADHNIYVKELSNRFDDNQGYLRIAVRTPAENQQFVDCLNDSFAELGGVYE